MTPQQRVKDFFEQIRLSREWKNGNLTPAEATEQELEQRMQATRTWLIEDQGYTAESLWPEWYPPGALPPWYQRLLDKE